MRYYIAYGSNLNVEQMRWRCPNARVVGTAELDGWELLFKGSKTGSYLTIEPKENAKVPVVIWATSYFDEKALDRYEGYPTFYYKREIEVDGKSCYVYIMHEENPLGIPSWSYVQTCMEGYRLFGFDERVLIDAIERSKAI